MQIPNLVSCSTIALALLALSCSHIAENPAASLPLPGQPPAPFRDTKFDITEWNSKILADSRGDGLLVASSRYEILQAGDLMQKLPHVSSNSWQIDRVFPESGKKTGFVHSERQVSDFNVSNDFYKHTILDFIALPCNGDILAVGSTWNTTNSYSHDWWIRRFSADGGEQIGQWTQQVSGGTWGIAAPFGMARDSAGNVYVAGVSYFDYNQNWWIRRFDGQGVEDVARFGKKFDANNGPDVAYAIAIDSRDNVYVTGTARNLSSANSGDDWWIKKFDRDGNEDLSAWNKSFDSGADTDAPRAIAIDGNDNIYVAGFMAGSGTNTARRYGIVRKFSADGIEDINSWPKKFYPWSDVTALTIDSSNNVYVAGLSASGAFVAIFRQDGQAIASHVYRSGDWALPRSLLINKGYVHWGGYACCNPGVHPWIESVPLSQLDDFSLISLLP